jgi:hypothetical protein
MNDQTFYKYIPTYRTKGSNYNTIRQYFLEQTAYTPSRSKYWNKIRLFEDFWSKVLLKNK